MNFAERFANMMTFTNGDVEMRRDMITDYEPYMRNAVSTAEVQSVVFNDDSMFMAIRDEIITTKDAEEGTNFLHWLLDNEPDVAVPLIDAMIKQMKAVFGDEFNAETIIGSV